MSKKFVVRCDHYSDVNYLFNQYEVFDSLADVKGYFDYYKKLPDYDSFSLLLHPIVLMSEEEVQAIESDDSDNGILVFRHDLIQNDPDDLTVDDVEKVGMDIATPTGYTVDINRHLHGYTDGKLTDTDTKFEEHLDDIYHVMTWFGRLPEIMSNDWNHISCENSEDRLSIRASYYNSQLDNMEMTTYFSVFSDKPHRQVPFIWEQMNSFMHNQSLDNAKKVLPKRKKIEIREDADDNIDLEHLDEDFVILDI